MNAQWALPAGLALTPWLVRVLAAGVLVAGTALVLGALLARHAPAARVRVWRAALVALLLLPLASAAPWRWNVSAPAPLDGFVARVAAAAGVGAGGAGATQAAEAAELAALDRDRPVQVSLSAAPPARSTASPTSPASGVEPRPRPFAAAASTWVPRLPLLWLVVVAGRLFYLAAGLLSLRLVSLRARDVTKDVLPLLEPARGGGAPHLRVMRGGPFRVPVCWGLVRPTVLLPAGTETWTEARTRTVLLHESVHVERSDGAFLLLAHLACALHWPNPLVAALARRLSADGEGACDDEVVARGVPARAYARTLVEVAREAHRHGHPRVALGLLRSGGLDWRVTRILARPARAAGSTRLPAAAAAGVTLMTALVGATVRVAPGLPASPAEAGGPRVAAAADGPTGQVPPSTPAPVAPGAPDGPADAATAFPAADPVAPGNPAGDGARVSTAVTLAGAPARSRPLARISYALDLADGDPPAPTDAWAHGAGASLPPAAALPPRTPSDRRPTAIRLAAVMTSAAGASTGPGATLIQAHMARVAPIPTGARALPKATRFDAERLATTHAQNVLHLLLEDLDWTLRPCGGPDVKCVMRGAQEPGQVRVYVDDRPLQAGLGELGRRSPREFYHVVYDGSVRAYTHSFVLRLAREAESATLARLRAEASH